MRLKIGGLPFNFFGKKDIVGIKERNIFSL
jgi:hypothetical protein